MGINFPVKCSTINGDAQSATFILGLCSLLYLTWCWEKTQLKPCFESCFKSLCFNELTFINIGVPKCLLLTTGHINTTRLFKNLHFLNETKLQQRYFGRLTKQTSTTHSILHTRIYKHTIPKQPLDTGSTSKIYTPLIQSRIHVYY